MTETETETGMAEDTRTPMHQYCPFSRSEWEHRLEGLGLLLDAKIDPVADGVNGINARLDRVNGKIADHESRLTKLETRVAAYVSLAAGLTGVLMWVADKFWK